MITEGQSLIQEVTQILQERKKRNTQKQKKIWNKSNPQSKFYQVENKVQN